MDPHKKTPRFEVQGASGGDSLRVATLSVSQGAAQCVLSGGWTASGGKRGADATFATDPGVRKLIEFNISKTFSSEDFLNEQNLTNVSINVSTTFWNDGVAWLNSSVPSYLSQNLQLNRRKLLVIWLLLQLNRTPRIQQIWDCGLCSMGRDHQPLELQNLWIQLLDYTLPEYRKSLRERLSIVQERMTQKDGLSGVISTCRLSFTDSRPIQQVGVDWVPLVWTLVRRGPLVFN